MHCLSCKNCSKIRNKSNKLKANRLNIIRNLCLIL